MAVEIWWSSLAAADRGLLSLLDSVERARVESLQRPADRGRSLLGAALLRVAVGAHLGVGPGAVVVDRTCTECGQPHGAPRILRPGRPAPWVSVSHSGVLVLVALSSRGPVGVDVQRHAEPRDPRSAREWVHREATLKALTAARAGRHPAADLPPDAVAGATRQLRAPLEGYAVAVTTLGEDHGEPVWRQWSPSDPPDRTGAARR